MRVAKKAKSKKRIIPTFKNGGMRKQNRNAKGLIFIICQIE